MNQLRQKQSAQTLLTFIESISITEFKLNQFKSSLPNKLGISSSKLWELWELCKHQLYTKGNYFTPGNFNLDCRYLINNHLLHCTGKSLDRVFYIIP